MPDGAAIADHQASAQAQWAKLGKRKRSTAAIDGAAQCPAELIYLWRYFIELSDGISAGGFGPAVVTWADIAAWRAEMTIDLAPWESRALVQLGALRATVAMEKPAVPSS